MVRIVYAEEELLSDIVNISKIAGFIPGLILGQNSGQKDYVIHLACTPLPSEEENEKQGGDDKDPSNNGERKSIDKLSEIEDYWLADHAKQVTRMLPGGMWVLGIFIIGPIDIFSNRTYQDKMDSLLFKMYHHLASDPYLYGCGPCSEKLIFHFSSITLKFTCKSYDIVSKSYRPVEWRFQGNNRWHQLECQYDFEQFATYHVTEKRANLPLKKQLKEVLSSLSENIQKAICTIDGEIKEDSSNLEVPDKNKKSKTSDEKSTENKVLQVNLYVPCEDEVKEKDELKIVDLVGEMKCTGVLSSKVFVNQNAKVEEAIKAVKEDIIRSWAARLQMHWDSLVEEEVGTPEEVMVVHELPRRVLIPLPHSKVELFDYLFPGEGPSEALISLEELLGVTVNECLVQKDFEGQPDIQNLTSGSEPPKTEMGTTTTSNDSPMPVELTLGISSALAILILSYIVRLYFYSIY